MCEQIKDHFVALSQYCSDITILAIAGDVSLKEQLYCYFYRILTVNSPRLKEGPDVLIGTPSRIAAHLVAKVHKRVSIDTLEYEIRQIKNVSSG